MMKYKGHAYSIAICDIADAIVNDGEGDLEAHMKEAMDDLKEQVKNQLKLIKEMRDAGEIS